MRKLAMTMLAAGLGTMGLSMAAAQDEAAEPTLQNAKVLPADLPRQQLVDLMKHMTQSLGVRCSYCHVGEEGAPLSTYDFASDDKPAKDRARAMLELTYAINTADTLPGEERASLHDMSENRVTCYTCHRGKERPATMVPQPEG